MREAQAHMEEAHEKNMEQVMETIHRQHEQDLELAKKQMQNEMKEVSHKKGSFNRNKIFNSYNDLAFLINLVEGW